MFKHLDDAGELTHNDLTVTITGKKALLTKSLDNYKKLMSLQGENNKHFQKYIPHNIEKVSDEELKITFFEKAYPLPYILSKFNNKLDQPHVNWILSRILEFSTWLSKIGVSHNGINLDSIYVIPRNHGMVCVSFYHMSKLEEKLSSVSGRHINLYPAYNLVKKITKSNIDIVCAKRTAMMLMGDASSLGDSFVNDVHYNNELIAYLRKEDHDCLTSYNEYRAILKRFYNTKQFHELTFTE